MRAWLQLWLTGNAVFCGQCGCLADRTHNSASCGRHLCDTIHRERMEISELQQEVARLRREVRGRG